MWTRELLGRQPLEVAFDRHRDSTCVVFFFGHYKILGIVQFFVNLIFVTESPYEN